MKVAIGVITDAEDRILITQRSHSISHGGFWEFPGGKLEQNETAEAALVREIKEELGVDVIKQKFLGEIKHQYSDKFVHLHIFHVSEFTGDPLCLDGQINMKWVDKACLNPEDFPEANHAILDML